MAINTRPPIPNPQLLNGMHFREPLTCKDISMLMEIYFEDDEGLKIDLKTYIEPVRNLMRHNLIKIDIFQDNEENYYAFSVTEAGKQMCDKMMELTKS